MYVQVPATSRHRDITAGRKSPKVVPPKHLQTWRLGHHFEERERPYKAVSSNILEKPSMGLVSNKLGRCL
jgi:hypothetical protein